MFRKNVLYFNFFLFSIPIPARLAEISTRKEVMFVPRNVIVQTTASIPFSINFFELELLQAALDFGPRKTSITQLDTDHLLTSNCS